MVKAALRKIEEERIKINWRINNKVKKQATSIIKGVGQINLMEDVCMTCANMPGVQLAIVDVSESKPLLSQPTWKFIKITMNKKTKTWMCNNKGAIAYLPMVFMGKLHQFFQHLPFFAELHQHEQVQIVDLTLEIKHTTIGVKLMAEFINKMVKHIDNNLLPKEIPASAKGLFVEQTAGYIALAIPNTE